MINPKTYFREMDAILAKIGQEKRGKNFLVSILSVVQQKFGDALLIKNSHIFEKRGPDYILVHSLDRSQKSGIVDRLPSHDPLVEDVWKHGSYLMDTPDYRSRLFPESRGEIVTPAVIAVNSPVRKWIFVFELKSGYVRDEVLFFLNALRTAFNYRFFSESFGNELEQAVHIQQSLLQTDPPKIPGFDMCGRSQPAGRVGGDFYEYFQFTDRNFGVCIGDASGHGLPAALLVRDAVIGLRMGLAKEFRLFHTLDRLNRVIQKSMYISNFISLFIGEIESDGHLFYYNAGHPAPFLIGNDGIHDLGPTGLVLGFLPETNLHRAYALLEPGSLLVLYTDGIVERQRTEDELFGVSRLKQLVMENRAKSAEDLVKLVFRKVFDFGNRAPWEDDATLVILKKDKIQT